MIRNIIFDFGNVLFDLDLPAFEREMRLLLGATFEETSAKLHQERVFDLYETGGISTAEFLDKIISVSAPPLQEAQVRDAWNAILIRMPRSRFEWLLELRQKYKVFLLSNINELHERWVADYIFREHGLEDYESRYFDGVYFSHHIRLRKPQPEVFEYVLADAEILPQETIFFDDMPGNIAAAQLLGIQSVWHEPGTEIESRLRQMALWPLPSVLD